MRLWRKAGVDFDRGCKSTLDQLLEIGGYFPLSKVQGRLPLSRNSMYQWSRGYGEGPHRMQYQKEAQDSEGHSGQEPAVDAEDQRQILSEMGRTQDVPICSGLLTEWPLLLELIQFLLLWARSIEGSPLPKSVGRPRLLA